jgi:hypothetical protein
MMETDLRRDAKWTKNLEAEFTNAKRVWKRYNEENHMANRSSVGFLIRCLVPPKHPPTFNGLHDVISQKIELFRNNKNVIRNRN